MMKISISLILFFSLNLFAADSGVFFKVTGKVLIQNDRTSVDAKVNSRVYAGDTIITYENSRAIIALDDKQRSLIHVNPNTHVKFEKYLEKEKVVELHLSEGTILNDIEDGPYKAENSHFEVKTPVAVVGVRGTAFIVKFDKNDSNTEVSTLRGEVQLQGLDTENRPDKENIVFIKAGERSNLRKGMKILRPTRIPTLELNRLNKESAVFSRAHQLPKKIKNSTKKRSKLRKRIGQ